MKRLTSSLLAFVLIFGIANIPQSAVAEIDYATYNLQYYLDQVPEPDPSKPFIMPFDDVFSVPNLGTIVVGRIEQGTINTGETVDIVGIRSTRSATVAGVYRLRKSLDQAQAGDKVEIILEGIQEQDIEIGQVLAQPDSIQPHTKFEADIYVVTKEEGGKYLPFLNDYRLEFYFHNANVTGVITLPQGRDIVRPGDKADMVVKLSFPIALAPDTVFTIYEGGKRVGVGRVKATLD